MNAPLQIPLFFPRRSKIADKGTNVLAADIGGTKTNLALFHATATGVELLTEVTYHSAEFHSFNEMGKKFLSENKLPLPDRICAGIAGPVVNGKVKVTNLSEELDTNDIRKGMGVEEVVLLNDLEATAYGLAALSDDDILTIHDGDKEVKGNMAIIAPGTGLGEAGLYWDGSFYHPFPTEGGHCDFSPRTEQDIALFRYLQQKYGIVSWEKLVAGPGIHDTYLFLRSTVKSPEPDWLTTELQAQDPSAVISHAGVNARDPVCVQVMELFVGFLARESASLVLKLKATGGLYLGGGIPPKIIPLLEKDIFMKSYLDCDRMQDLLEKCPIHIITKDKAALLGAAYYGAYGK